MLWECINQQLENMSKVVVELAITNVIIVIRVTLQRSI